MFGFLFIKRNERPRFPLTIVNAWKRANNIIFEPANIQNAYDALLVSQHVKTAPLSTNCKIISICLYLLELPAITV